MTRKLAKPAKASTVPGKRARLTRAQRWADAANKAQLAKSDLDEALSVLVELHQEFEDWRDNLPENLQSSPLGEKLDAVCDLDIDRDGIMDLLDVLDEAESLDLPLGFGRD
jgi:hypothetical protein